jgi:predicted GNAT family acetyltransferase
MPTPDAGPPPTIVDNADERRYEARVDGELAGWVDYGRVHNRLVALHTEVPARFGGRGIGSALIRRVLDDARATGLKVTPRCPFFLAHFQRHPEDADLAIWPPGMTPPDGATG